MFGGCAQESQRKRGARGESERPGGVRGVADGVQGNERKQEVARGEAGGGRGSVGERHASPLFVLLAEEEEDKGGGGGLGRLGKLGRWWRQVRFFFSLCLLSNYFSFLFCRFVLNLVLKPIQFILLLTIFLGAKRIKTMLHKNISELLDLYLFNSRYKSNSNSYDLNSKSQK